jgi:hypothetical protein
MRHIKLWFAGKLSNWRLARYELDQLESNLKQAGQHLPWRSFAASNCAW